MDLLRLDYISAIRLEESEQNSVNHWASLHCIEYLLSMQYSNENCITMVIYYHVLIPWS